MITKPSKPPRATTLIRWACAAAVLLAAAHATARADDLWTLADEFNDPSTLVQWHNRHALETPGVDPFARLQIAPDDFPGALLMQPHTVTWYGGYRGPLLYKDITGDFVITTHVTVSNAALAGMPTSAFSLAGPMIRAPLASPGAAENYVFLSLGYGDAGHPSNPGPGPHFEVKTTIDGNSDLQLSPAETLEVSLQIARIGPTIVTLYQRPDEAWTVREVYPRPDLPPTLQSGLVAYTDWSKVSTYSPGYHNTHALVPPLPGDPSTNPALPFRPDLLAAFDFARFARPQVPDGLNPATATDDELLSFLGEHATPPALIPGDINRDGQVNAHDAAQFSQHFGETSGSTWTTGDFNNDGATTLADLALLQAHASPPTPQPATQPATQPIAEPTTLTLLAASLCYALWPRAARRYLPCKWR